MDPESPSLRRVLHTPLIMLKSSSARRRHTELCNLIDLLQKIQADETFDDLYVELKTMIKLLQFAVISKGEDALKDVQRFITIVSNLLHMPASTNKYPEHESFHIECIRICLERLNRDLMPRAMKGRYISHSAPMKFYTLDLFRGLTSLGPHKIPDKPSEVAALYENSVALRVSTLNFCRLVVVYPTPHRSDTDDLEQMRREGTPPDESELSTVAYRRKYKDMIVGNEGGRVALTKLDSGLWAKLSAFGSLVAVEDRVPTERERRTDPCSVDITTSVDGFSNMIFRHPRLGDGDGHLTRFRVKLGLRKVSYKFFSPTNIL
jgi:hypothetical protein